MTSDGMQHVVPDNLLRHIGDITVSFQLLETSIRHLIWPLIVKDQEQRIGQIITSEIPFRTLRSLAVSLYRERHGEDDDFANLCKLMNRAKELEGKRNQITHSMWGAGDTSTEVVRIKATAKEKRGLHFDYEHLDERTLASVATEMKRLAGDIWICEFGLRKAGKLLSGVALLKPDSPR